MRSKLLFVQTVFLISSSLTACCFAATGSLRIVDWNIEDDINGATTPLPGLNTVLQGVGQEIVGSDAARPLDIMALEETTSNATTVAPIVADLNGDYGAGTYAMTPYQATQSGSAGSGNGPNSLVYNTKTVTLISATGVGTPGGAANGEYRQVVRYEFMPIGGTAPFYIYDSHMKSGSGTTNAAARGEEATIIRADEAANLPANASVIYTGDLNADPSETNETQFTIFGNTATQGSATDPYGYSISLNLLTESATDLRYRDDYQLMTSNVLNDTGPLDYVANSLHSFGNNGSSGTNVTSASNTDLSYMTTAHGYAVTQSQILAALGTASDHLPNVADYTFAEASVPEPGSLAMMGIAAATLLSRRRGGLK